MKKCFWGIIVLLGSLVALSACDNEEEWDNGLPPPVILSVSVFDAEGNDLLIPGNGGYLWDGDVYWDGKKCTVDTMYRRSSQPFVHYTKRYYPQVEDEFMEFTTLSFLVGSPSFLCEQDWKEIVLDWGQEKTTIKYHYTKNKNGSISGEFMVDGKPAKLLDENYDILLIEKK